LCKSEGIQIINIVRREEQKELLKELGAEIVLNSSATDFPKQLWDVCQQSQSRLAFDAVAGPLTIQLLKAMPVHSKVVVYGGLSYEPTQIEAGQLIFEGKSIEGFWLTTWMSKKSFLQSLAIWRRAQKLITTDLKSEIRMQFPLNEVQNAIKAYQSQMTGGKILLIPAH
jgi:NADPH:quinone reductase-like Zn-dependent oxidoreductase